MVILIIRNRRRAAELRVGNREKFRFADRIRTGPVTLMIGVRPRNLGIARNIAGHTRRGAISIVSCSLHKTKTAHS